MREKSRILSTIGNHSLLEVIPGLTELILEKGQTRLLHVGEELCRQGDPVEYFIMPISASVRLMVSSGGVGNETLVGHLQKNRALGLHELFDQLRYPFSAVAETPVMVLYLPKKDFLALVSERPEIRHYLTVMTTSSGIRSFKSYLTERKIDQSGLFSIFSTVKLESVHLKRRQQLDLSQRNLWFVAKGHLRVKSLPGQLHDFSTHIGEGAWFGGESLVPPFKVSYEVLALEDTRLQRAPLDELGPIVDRLGLTEAIVNDVWLDKAGIGREPDFSGKLTDLPGRVVQASDVADLRLLVDLRDFRPVVSDQASIVSSLSWLASLLGRPINLSSLRADLLIDQKATFLRLAEALEPFGFYAKGLKADLSTLPRQNTPSILKFGPRLVVLLRINLKKNEILLLDPARGLIVLSTETFAKHWDGFLLEVSAVDDTTRDEKENKKDAPKEASQQNPPTTRESFLSAAWKFRQILVNVIILSLGSFGLALLIPLFSQHILDEVIKLEGGGLPWVYITGFFLTTLFAVVVTTTKQIALAEFSLRYDQRLSTLFYRHALSLPSRFYSNTKVGDIMTRLMEISKIRQFLSGSSLQVILDLFSVVIYAVVLFFYSWKIAVVALVLLVVAVIVQISFKGTIRRNYDRALDAEIKAKSLLSEQISAMASVKASGAENSLRAKWEKAFLRGVQLRRKIEFATTGVGSLMGFLSSMARLGGLWIAASIALQGKLSAGQILAVSMYLNNIIGPVSNIARIFLEIEQIKVSFRKVSEVGQAEPDQTASRALVTHSMPLKGKLKFERVYFRYQDDTPWVLRNVNFAIYPRQVVAIVGRSGCGKTTLANLIAGNLKPTTGRLFFDDFESSFLTLTSLRKQIGFIMQANELFAGTVGENVAFADDAPGQEDIHAALQGANASGFVSSFPAGTKHYLGEGGLGLSGGQRQRLTISRTLYRNPRILIMDEATSSLDAESEKAIVENMREIVKGKTAIIIAHRLSTIRNADRILVMQDGEIVEEGTHAALLSRGGHYSELFENQVCEG